MKRLPVAPLSLFAAVALMWAGVVPVLADDAPAADVVVVEEVSAAPAPAVEPPAPAEAPPPAPEPAPVPVVAAPAPEPAPAPPVAAEPVVVPADPAEEPSTLSTEGEAESSAMGPADTGQGAPLADSAVGSSGHHDDDDGRHDDDDDDDDGHHDDDDGHHDDDDDDNNNYAKKVTFCHATGSESNPFVRITTSVNAFFNAGHHTHQGLQDIVPPFSYEQHGHAMNFPGLNWTSSSQTFLDHGCKDKTPKVASASVEITMPTCEQGALLLLGSVTGTHASWGSSTDHAGPLALYNVVSTADDGYVFAPGAGVSPDGKTKTYTGSLAGPLSPTSPECRMLVATASVTLVDATCTAGQWLILGPTAGTNASWVNPANLEGPQDYSVVSVANLDALFAPGVGVSPDRTTQTFAGTLGGPLPPRHPDCALVATASVTLTPPTCAAGELLTPDPVAETNATWSDSATLEGPLDYSLVSTANANALFAAGEGVSEDRTTKTFAGALAGPLSADDPACVFTPFYSWEPADCATAGSYTLGGEGVAWTVNGTPTEYGTYPAVTPSVVILVASPENQPVASFTIAQSDEYRIEYVEPTGCGGTPNPPAAVSSTGLAQTGFAGLNLAALAALIIAGGLAMFVVRRRT